MNIEPRPNLNDVMIDYADGGLRDRVEGAVRQCLNAVFHDQRVRVKSRVDISDVGLRVIEVTAAPFEAGPEIDRRKELARLLRALGFAIDESN